MTPSIRRWPGPRGPAAFLALLCLMSVAATPAVAEGGVAGTPYIDCKCRANGRTFGLGERACVYTPDGPRIARCRMVQNVTSWAVEDGQGCVSSALRPGGGASRG
jgi:hypothetical protein